jgi:hypothetical protein
MQLGPQADLLRRLKFERLLPSQVADLFHEIRILGNRASHGASGTAAEALNALKYARQAGVWFHRTYGKDPKFVAGYNQGGCRRLPVGVDVKRSSRIAEVVVAVGNSGALGLADDLTWPPTVP